jgi:hypothetical protein
VWCFFIGKQKVVLFPKYRKNGWKTDGSALTNKSIVAEPAATTSTFLAFGAKNSSN